MFGQTILLILFYFLEWSKWFEKKMMLNCLTLRISRWYKWLRFKDIVYGFGKLKKMVEKKWNGMEWFVGLESLMVWKSME